MYIYNIFCFVYFYVLDPNLEMKLVKIFRRTCNFIHKDEQMIIS